LNLTSSNKDTQTSGLLKRLILFAFLLGFIFVSCRFRQEPDKIWNLRDKIKTLSLDLVGLPYRIGGKEITGFDCSGFVYYVLSSFGIEIPRTAKKQGNMKNSIRLNKARTGDILVFKLKRGWHSGIYIGDNHFVHAPNQNSQVRKEELTAFWVSRLKRVIQVIEG